MRLFRALLNTLSALVGSAARAVSSAARSAAAALARALRGIGHGAATAGRGAVALLPAEWKKPIAALFVVGLALVPLVYSGNMTWSFLDPSNNLDQVTAAVVDEDEGATATSPDGTESQLDVGAEFTETLLDMDKSTVYRFVEVSPGQAQQGLADGTYGATVEIPADFSANIASLGGDDVERAAPAMLTVTTNDSVNYVGGNFTKSVGTALTESLRASVLEEYLGKIYVGFTTVHDGIGDAADGAGELADGTVTLHDGTGELVDGSGELADGTGQLVDGSSELADGASTLHQGTLDLVVGLDQLSAGAVTLRDGTAVLDAGVQDLRTGLVTLDENGRPLRSGAQQLASGADQLATGAGDVADGAGQVAEGTQQLDETVGAAQERIDELGVTPEGVERTSEDLVAAIDALEGIASGLPDRLADPVEAAGIVSEAADSLDETVTRLDQSSQELDVATTDRTEDARTLRDDAATIDEDVTALDEDVQGVAQATDTAEQSATTADESVDGYTRRVDELAEDCAGSGADEDFCARLSELSEQSEQVRGNAAQGATDATTADDAASTAAEASTDISDTAERMNESAGSLATYLEELQESTSALAEGSSALADTTGTLAEDASALEQDLASLQEDATTSVPSPGEGTSASDLAAELAEQARTAAEALPGAYDALAQGVEDVHRLNSGAQQVATGADQLATATGTARDGADDLAGGLTRYTDGVGTARTGAQQLADGTGQLTDGSQQLAVGTSEAEAGARQLADGAGQLEDGTDELHDGAVQVDDGASDLADGAVELDDGAGELADGSEELHEGLVDAQEDIPSYTDAESEDLAGVASEAVQMSFERENELERFGEGLAPLFLAISLWVGGMAIFLMMPPFSEQAAARGVGPVRLLAGGLVPAIALGLVQTVIAVVALHRFVGVTMQDVPLMLGLAGLASAVFVALNHGFGAVFGSVGKFVALVLVALQISGAGGTYPTQTLPGFFQAIHLYLPMTHAVDAFRGAIGGGWIDPVGDLQWLGGWLILGVALGLVGAVLRHRRALDESTVVA